MGNEIEADAVGKAARSVGGGKEVECFAPMQVFLLCYYRVVLDTVGVRWRTRHISVEVRAIL